MLILILLLLGGFILGHFFHKHSLLRWSTGKIPYIIYALLFFMGGSIGSNAEIMDNLGTLGVDALIITLGGVLGSLIAGAVVSRLFFNKKEEVKE